jgi:hypothetical protein
LLKIYSYEKGALALKFLKKTKSDPLQKFLKAVFMDILTGVLYPYTPA